MDRFERLEQDFMQGFVGLSRQDRLTLAQRLLRSLQDEQRLPEIEEAMFEIAREMHQYHS